MLIRAEDNQLQAVQIGKYQFQYPQGILIFADNFRKLTNRESEILQLLLLNRNNILERNVILKTLWQNDNYFSGRCLDVFVAKFRKYLKDDPYVFIINIRGQGYKLIY